MLVGAPLDSSASHKGIAQSPKAQFGCEIYLIARNMAEAMEMKNDTPVEV